MFKSVSCQLWETIMNGADVEPKGVTGTKTHPPFCFFLHVQRFLMTSAFDLTF